MAEIEANLRAKAECVAVYFLPQPLCQFRCIGFSTRNMELEVLMATFHLLITSSKTKHKMLINILSLHKRKSKDSVKHLNLQLQTPANIKNKINSQLAYILHKKPFFIYILDFVQTSRKK